MNINRHNLFMNSYINSIFQLRSKTPLIRWRISDDFPEGVEHFVNRTDQFLELFTDNKKTLNRHI